MSTTTVEQDYGGPELPSERAVAEYTGKEGLRAIPPSIRAQYLQTVLGLSEDDTKFIALAITAAENSAIQEAIDLACRRGLVDGNGPQRSGYETFRRSIIKDLKRSKRQIGCG